MLALADEHEAMRLAGPQIVDDQLDHRRPMDRDQRLWISVAGRRKTASTSSHWDDDCQHVRYRPSSASDARLTLVQGFVQVGHVHNPRSTLVQRA